MTDNAYLDAMVKVAAALPGKALMSTFGGKAGNEFLAANHTGFMGHLTGTNADAHLQHTIVQHVEANKGKLTRSAGMEKQEGYGRHDRRKQADVPEVQGHRPYRVRTVHA